MLEKSLKFKNIAIYETLATFIGAVASIIIALNGGGVWSLVYQTLIISTIIAISVIILTGFPSIKQFDFNEIKSIYKFSLNLLGFNIVNYFVRNADYILIGKFLGTSELGYYSLAYRIMLYPIQNITNIISRVMLPIYSRLQENLKQFQDVYKKVCYAIASITFPLMFGIAVLSLDFVELFLGDKWEIVGLLLIFIAPVGALQSIATTSGSIYQAIGRTDVMFKWGIFSSFAFILSFIIGLRWGILGVSISYLVMNLLIFYPWLKMPFRLIDFKMNVFFNSLRPIFFSTIIMAGSILVFRSLFANQFNKIFDLTISVIIGAGFFVSLLYAFDKRNLIGLIKQIRS